MFKKKLLRFLSENKNTCFEVIYKGEKKPLLEVMKEQYKNANPFKETIDLVASICLDRWFSEKYPEMPRFKTQITLRNLAETIRAGIDRYAGRKSLQANALLESFDLLHGETISVQNSKYAQHFIKQLNSQPANTVINFSDIYTKVFDGHIDKRFGISYELMPIVLLSLVYSGNAVITLRSGTMLTASDLESLPKTSVMDIWEFKYITKPKDVQLAELVRMYELLDLPTGLINNPAQREVGLEQMLTKAQAAANSAVRAHSKLSSDFELWGEPLVGGHIAQGYKQAAINVRETFSNFSSRFNTVAKLNNFTYTMGQVEQLSKDMTALKLVLEYEIFKNECAADVGYIMSLERMELPTSITDAISDAKENFRKIRDHLPVDMSGEESAADVVNLLARVKAQYIELYFAEHQKKRLGVSDGKRKGEVVSSSKLANLKRLKTIGILSASKLDSIEKDLSGLKVCFELTAEMLKAMHFCTKCHFHMVEGGLPVKGKLDEIEERMDILLAEWAKTLLNTISDPLVLDQTDYLTPDQQSTVGAFLKTKALPDKIDTFFVGAIEALLQGFEPVTINASDLMDKLDAIGPCDVETFKARVSALVEGYTKGKDKGKLRIVVKR